MATTTPEIAPLKPVWKLWVVAGGAILVEAGWFFGCKTPALASQYPTMVGGVLALCGMFLTGQVVNNWVVGKHQVAMKDENGDGVEDAPESGAGTKDDA